MTSNLRTDFFEVFKLSFELLSGFLLSVQLLLELRNVSSSTHLTHLGWRWFYLWNRSHLIFFWEITNFILVFTFINPLINLFLSLILSSRIIDNFTNFFNIIFVKFINSLINFHLFLRIWFLTLCNWFNSWNLRSDLRFWYNFVRNSLIESLHVVSR